MGKILKKLNVLLDGKQKRFMIVLLLMMLFGALLETASVTIIIPVVTLLMDANAVENNEIVA
ncbi:MAG: ABC transporter ATP-binding protein, partial [Lachnospiraceae bacterium]|nr:ABC transporter ATP-binding protein [Lachnospiraceae bacterium]